MTEKREKAKFDMEEAAAAARDYALATGTECLVLAANGDGIINPCEGEIHDHLCYAFSPEIAKACQVAHYEGALKSLDPDEPKAYFCPMGLMHWAAPIIQNGEIVAAFIAGHTFLNQPRSDLADLKTLTAAHEALLNKIPSLKKTLLASPVITNDQLTAMKNMLNRLAASFSDHTAVSGEYRDLREAFERNMRLEETPAFSWKELLEAFDAKNDAGVEKAIDAIAGAIGRSADPAAAKAALTRIVLTIYDRSLDREGQCFFEERCLAALNELDRIETVGALTDWTKNNLKRLLEASAILPGVKNANMIYSALQYIDDHYSEKFSLQDIADHVHFSAPYFSKVFKREMDMTFTKYLTNLRIEKSKALLKNRDFALADIPAMVGFEEQSYFTRVFRLNTGISPGKYRERESQ